MPENALPTTVVTAHLASCAEELSAARLSIVDLPAVAANLVAGQKDIARALDRLATRLARGPVTEDRAALVEVLRAAAAASSHAAEALEAGGHLFESVANETAF